MITTIWGTTKKPISSQRLADFFQENPQLTGTLYLGYPVIGTPEGAFPIDAIWINEEKGIILFNLVEGRSLNGYDEVQDDSANKLEAKLRNHRTLMQGRKLLVNITPITFAPLSRAGDAIDEYHLLANEETLLGCIENIPNNSRAYHEAVAVIQSISTIRKGVRRRNLTQPDSRGAKLKRLEDSIANLDNLQGRAVIETVEGVQRIRGLAGSGKTIILALKAAYLHAQHPDWKIAVTFHTRSLKGQFKRLINTFFIEQTNEEPDWNNLQVINSWGAPGSSERNGVYYTYCKETGAEYLDLAGAKEKFNYGKEFEGACELALTQAISLEEQVYDAILVDEAQDLSAAFLKICYQLLGKKKRLVYAYDELQNLGSSSLPPPEDIFGNDEKGNPVVSFDAPVPGKPQQDIILEKCYRNSRPILATAHALGFGIYRTPPTGLTTGLIQMFDQKNLWLDVGYVATEGRLEDGQKVRLSRTEESSPKFLEDHSDVNDLIQFHVFNNEGEQAAWLANAVKQNLTKDELTPHDIVVINPDPLSTRKAVGPIRKILFDDGISTHLAGVDTSPDVFFDDDGDSIAFTGIFRAKGNEAGMVYIINAQDCYGSWGSPARVRNQLFTAITRSKGWVRVLGTGPNMEKLRNEYEETVRNKFDLQFTYPTADERKHLNIINRDKDERIIRQGADSLNNLINDMLSGNMYIEDLPPVQVETLRRLLTREEKNK
ncbi:DEAD/DEAH box helicase [Pseudoduganella chitinolytica]|uniref:DNA 3'-5' helicase II n=1 Tax=Pseudoduganella chitinolytica TaxID=34070 RepID=A0ABY8B7D7_9BURK|nr:ATP-binding domain-containing protein [Pseudoduganella chitinolytica]WEF30921.1 ATP-binding domain-containing protein [Pseudoduganella chitinolytica]